ncbi:hypothetical protein L1987_54735 [Smallanthus sonchifolius]|uniref:Uncharacterized protein n=1 Tax=Smallanthus sonchifolius TaxID=185202 RepID=A0ACB9E7F1_9ASTR|nr:hypothetical protein L1987_54735 [Smallanthus sonchifolius]
MHVLRLSSKKNQQAKKMKLISTDKSVKEEKVVSKKVKNTKKQVNSDDDFQNPPTKRKQLKGDTVLSIGYNAHDEEHGIKLLMKKVGVYLSSERWWRYTR